MKMKCKHCGDTSFTDIGLAFICDSCGSGYKKDFHTTKHNRDVELTDLLAELAERYGHIMRKHDLERIAELTGGQQ